MQETPRIAIIGGGAAGFFAAITAAEKNPAAEILIYESTRKPLAKVLISGGGRCNVTNHCFDPGELVKNYPRGHKELLGPFHHFQPRDTIAWFEKHGVRLKVESDNRVFPVTDSAGTIADCLTRTALSLGVKIKVGTAIRKIARVVSRSGNSEFEIELQDGQTERALWLLLATGGGTSGHRLAQSLGHTIVPPVPSLFTFKISDPRLKNLSGVAFDNIHLFLKSENGRAIEQSGSLLITHWGLSGPAVLKLSAWGARTLHESRYRAELTVNFLPGHTAASGYETLLGHKSEHPRKLIKNTREANLPARYWERILSFLAIPDTTRWADISARDLHALSLELTQAKFKIIGKGQFKEEFVTCGGVSLKEVDFRTMESKVCPGLYLAGEIIDIDGLTGGFNFQNAWTTAWIAGINLASKDRV